MLGHICTFLVLVVARLGVVRDFRRQSLLQSPSVMPPPEISFPFGRARRCAPFAYPNSAPPALERDPLEHVRDRLARIDGGLERLEDVLPADHDHRVDAAGEQRGHGVALQTIAVVLQAMDLDQVRRSVRHHRRAGSAAPRGSPRRRRRARRRTLPPAPSALRPRTGRAGRPPARCSRRRRRARSPARSRRRRRTARAPAAPPPMPVDDVVSDAIALALARGEVLGERGVLGKRGQQLAQQQRRALDVAPGVLEQGRQGRVDRSSEHAHPRTPHLGARAGVTAKTITTAGRRGELIDGDYGDRPRRRGPGLLSSRVLHDSITTWQLGWAPIATRL